MIYQCLEHVEDLLNTFDINVQHDSSTIHPPNFCHLCKSAIYNKTRQGFTVQRGIVWEVHTDDCKTCQRAEKMRAGGHPSKTPVGRPALLSRRAMLSHLQHIAPHQPAPPSTHMPHTYMTPPNYGVSLEDLTCPICMETLIQPIVLSSCGTVVCAGCLRQWLSDCDSSLPCPCCYSHFSGRDDIKSAPAMQQQLLSGLLVSCTCGERVSNGNFAAHARGECNTSVTVSAQSTVHDVLSKPKDSPLTPLEMELQTTLAKRSLATSPEQCLLQMKTGGQVYQLKSINT